MNVSAAERIADLRQRWPAPSRPMNIVFVGSGSIVNDAHAPAYRLGRLPIAGAYDLDPARARATAAKWALPQVFARLEDAFATPEVVFDVALPPQALADVLPRLPDGAVVLIQKPLGLDLADATRLRELCRRKRLIAAVNFQLRFSPLMLALRDAVERAVLGRILDVEVLVNCRMPWELWPFMESLARMEIALHSIHYLDTIRALLGEPRSVFARTVKHPDVPKLASSRTSAILDYADDVRVCLSINHHHKHGPKHEVSQMRVEGTHGAALATMGVNLDYPRGRPDALEIADGASTWRSVPLVGNWFPDAFLGTMSNLQRVARGEERVLHTSVEDAWHTMALVEALYMSDATRGTPVPRENGARA